MNYFVGPYNFMIEFQNEEEASRFLELMQQHKSQEEEKLAKLRM
jgi:hypothetical protein